MGWILVNCYGILIELILPLAAIGIITFRGVESFCDKRKKNTQN